MSIPTNGDDFIVKIIGHILFDVKGFNYKCPTCLKYENTKTDHTGIAVSYAKYIGVFDRVKKYIGVA